MLEGGGACAQKEDAEILQKKYDEMLSKLKVAKQKHSESELQRVRLVEQMNTLAREHELAAKRQAEALQEASVRDELRALGPQAARKPS